MKKYIYIYALIIALFPSCYEDKGNYDYTEKLEITINGLDTIYDIISLDTLRIDITPSPSNSNSNYKCYWAVYMKGIGSPIIDTISHETDLNYKINLMPGRYGLICSVVDSKSGVGKVCESELNVETELTQGWWILKDKDNVADLDHYNGKRLSTNVVTSINKDFKLAGNAVSLNYYPILCDYDPKSNRFIKKVALFVFTENDGVAITLADGKIIRTFDKMFFSPPMKQRPMKILYDMMSGVYLINDGKVHTIDESLPNSGLFSLKKFADEVHNLPDNDISQIAIKSGSAFPLLFDNATKSFCTATIKGNKIIMLQNGVKDATVKLPPVRDTESDLLMMGGRNYDARLMKILEVFTLMKKGNTHFLTKMNADCAAPYYNPITKQDTLDNSLHLVNADVRATNADMDVVYSAKGNKVYSYNVTSKRETEQITNIPANEKITYLSHLLYRTQTTPQFWFDYLVIATESNGRYKVYRYKLLGEDLEPNSEPVIEGDGRVKQVFYRDKKFASVTF